MIKTTDETNSKVGPMVLSGGIGFVAGMLGSLGISKPAKAASQDENMQYLSQLMEAMVASNMEMIRLLTSIEAGQGGQVPGIPGIEVTVSTPWKADEPVLMFDQAIRDVGPFETNFLIDCRDVKRIYFKVESSLNQAVNIQFVSNLVDSFQLATNIDGVLPVAVNGNIHVGLAWDDWGPYVGATITAGVAPASGNIKIYAVVQR